MRRLCWLFLDLTQVAVFAVAIFLVIHTWVLQPHKIKGASIEPNFHSGDYLLADKLTYRFKPPRRGDVVLFDVEGTHSDEFIKRIVGLPEETVSIIENKIYVNGRQLAEPYLPQGSQTSAGAFLPTKVGVTVPPDHYFVLGDNRGASADSRTWGFISTAKITGRAWLVFWPL